MRSFVAVDRHDGDCIGDGLGQNENDPCLFSKAGYSLPATSLVISWSGIDALHNRNSYLGRKPINDDQCAEGIHWNQSKAIRFNYMDIGSETPTQLGWYMVMLCLEYERYRQMNESILQRRSLEELFLALQALRRLDMQAQCAAEKLYEMARKHNKPQCCDAYYGLQEGKTEIHSFLTSGTFSSSCNFKKFLSGYTGFFIRADAPLSIRDVLHDASTECYQVDGIDCNFARAAFPCTQKSIDERACYLYHQQAYMSQDQILGVLNGLIMVKRFIPDSAKVQLCNGKILPVLEIAKKYTAGLISKLEKTYKNRIVFPGILDCVEGLSDREIKDKLYFSNFEGGQVSFIMHPMRKMKAYICDEKFIPDANQKRLWWLFKNWALFSSSNASFYVLLAALSEENLSKDLMSFCEAENKEIYLILHALLYKESIEKVLHNYDKKRWYNSLCYSPDEGHCIKQKKYPPDTVHKYPNFLCNVTGGWLGQRWDGAKRNDKLVYSFNENHKNAWPPNRIFNGLDYINYYLMYRLLIE